MDSNKFKYIYSFTMLVFTIGWAAFCVWITFKAIKDFNAADILMSAGANVLLGAMLTWMGNVNQFWFRKKQGQGNAAER